MSIIIHYYTVSMHVSHALSCPSSPVTFTIQGGRWQGSDNGNHREGSSVNIRSYTWCWLTDDSGDNSLQNIATPVYTCTGELSCVQAGKTRSIPSVQLSLSHFIHTLLLLSSTRGLSLE